MSPSSLARSTAVLLVATLAACVGEMPPPPELRVTSPERGMVRGEVGQVLVEGVALPGADGSPVTRVRVNDVAATLAADGSFSAVVELPPGAMLLQTSATSEAGGAAIDARAVQVGELRPVGTRIDRAVLASLSTEAFAKLSAAAGPLIEGTDFTTLLAPMQPMANLGDGLANLKLSVTQLTLGDVQITLTPGDGGLAFSAQLSGIQVAANAAYGGTLVPDGTTSVNVSADRITIAGTLVSTPAGTAGFTSRIASPNVQTTALRLQASGLAGRVLTLLNDNLGSTVRSIVTSSAEAALEPILNDALGALGGPQRIDVLGETLELQASPSALTVTRDGALVAIDVQAKLDGGEASAGYVFTPNGTPDLDLGRGLQLGLADDLLNQLLAQAHARGLLDIHLEEDFGFFDTIDLRLSMPPMVSANNEDGSMRLVLGDMIATISDHGQTVLGAAINASVDLEILRGDTPEQIAIEFGKVRLFVNIVGGDEDAGDLTGAAKAGISLQLDAVKQFLITVPVPSVAGVSIDSLSLRADRGYVIAAAEIR